MLCVHGSVVAGKTGRSRGVLDGHGQRGVHENGRIYHVACVDNRRWDDERVACAKPAHQNESSTNFGKRIRTTAWSQRRSGY